MDTQPPLDDPLRARFSGKRRWVRTPRRRPVELAGRKNTFTGLLLDLSRGGLQVALKDPAFYEGSEDGLVLVTRRFPKGAMIRFLEEDIERRAQIVRITPYEEQWLSLGCQFERPLTSAEAISLGMAGESFSGEAGGREIQITSEE